MSVWIALIRGINVGGRTVRMKELVSLLESLGYEDVRTYVQSGNAVFRSNEKSAAAIGGKIGKAIEKQYGFEPSVMMLTAAQLKKAAAGNPFPEADENPKSLHLFFLREAPKKPDLEKLQSLATKTERFALSGAVFYLHAPDGFGTSKLGERAEKALGVAATGRNWRTVQALLEMVK